MIENPTWSRLFSAIAVEPDINKVRRPPPIEPAFVLNGFDYDMRTGKRTPCKMPVGTYMTVSLGQKGSGVVTPGHHYAQPTEELVKYIEPRIVIASDMDVSWRLYIHSDCAILHAAQSKLVSAFQIARLPLAEIPAEFWRAAS
jgi:hypothetical protein